ncbi:MAG: RsmB/NOP family class I SAM-dependent RNA methyltransferase [Candidatus Parcubacteria bacterium]|nr:RsmB/NOP family class I SAM-dependent RNA methyltransferase [Burkholderiales bacterium]
MRPTPALLAHACAALTELLRFAGPADQSLSAYFRSNRNLGQQDRGFIAEAVFAVLRRKRSLEAAAGSGAPRSLVVAALIRIFGLSGRALEDRDAAISARVKSADSAAFPPAVQADLPDWLWTRLEARYGAAEAMAIARGLLGAAPLDLRVNLAKLSREEALARLEIEAAPTPHSPAGIRLKGKPQINRHALFLDGSLEVQDEGSQLLAYLLAPRRGEMVADFCAGAGGKTLALSMLMHGAGRIYAMDVSEKRLRELAPRAARAGISNVHPIVLSGEGDIRAKRLAGKLDRVLVDAPCSGFGTLRRNPDLKWRQGETAIAELAAKQARILKVAAKLLKPGGRLVYATCSILPEENEAVADRFAEEHPGFAPLSCKELLATQRVKLETGERLRLWPHQHGTDGFFAAAFQRV